MNFRNSAIPGKLENWRRVSVTPPPDENGVLATNPGDTRIFRVSDMAALVEKLNADNKTRKTFVDYDHQTRYSGSTAAIGWVHEFLLSDEGGLDAVVELAVDAWAYIKGENEVPRYKYVSLDGMVDPNTREVLSIRALALTNDPAMAQTGLEIASRQPQQEEEMTADKTPAAPAKEETARNAADTEQLAALNERLTRLQEQLDKQTQAAAQAAAEATVKLLAAEHPALMAAAGDEARAVALAMCAANNGDAVRALFSRVNAALAAQTDSGGAFTQPPQNDVPQVQASAIRAEVQRNGGDLSDPQQLLAAQWRLENEYANGRSQ